MALTVIQAPPPCGDSERAESVSPSTTLRMASSKQQQQRPPSPGSVLLTSATSAIEQRRVTAPQPPHVSLQVTASSTMNARYLMLLLNWFVGGFRLAMLPWRRLGARRLQWQGYFNFLKYLRSDIISKMSKYELFKYVGNQRRCRLCSCVRKDKAIL